jgi:hypothetical protein
MQEYVHDDFCSPLVVSRVLIPIFLAVFHFFHLMT